MEGFGHGVGNATNESVAANENSPESHEDILVAANDNNPEKSTMTAEAAAQEKNEIESKLAADLNAINETRAKLGLSPLAESNSVSAQGYRVRWQELSNIVGTEANDNDVEKEFWTLFGGASFSVERREQESGLPAQVLYYLLKILGPKETVRRMKEMGPDVVSFIKHEKPETIIWVFTLHDPELKKKAEELDAQWHAEHGTEREQNGTSVSPMESDQAENEPPSLQLFRNQFDADMLAVTAEGAPANDNAADAGSQGEMKQAA